MKKLSVLAIAVISLMLLSPESHATAALKTYTAHGSYDAATQVFDMSNPSNYEISVRSGSNDQFFDFSGYHTLVFDVDPDGTFGPGIFALYGTLPGLGIDQSTLLVSAVVTGGSADVVGSQPCGPFFYSGCPEGGSEGLVDMIVDLQTVSTAAFLAPYWGPDLTLDWQISVGGVDEIGFGGSPMNDDTLFHYNWSGTEPDYWFMSASNPVPVSEPTTAWLIGLGLAGLGIVRRKRLL